MRRKGPLSLTLPQMGGDCKQGLGSLLNINTFDFSVCFPASHLGPTGDFRVATGCGCGPIKGSESPFATEAKGLGVGEGRLLQYLLSAYDIDALLQFRQLLASEVIYLPILNFEI